MSNGESHLSLRRRLSDAPHDVREQPPAAPLEPLRHEQLGDIRHERRGQRLIALLVRAPVAEHDPLARPRDARVEEVALAVERALGRSQPQPRCERELVALIVGQKRLARARERKLPFAEAAHEHGTEATSPDRKRLRQQHRARTSTTGRGDQLKLLEHLQQHESPDSCSPRSSSSSSATALSSAASACASCSSSGRAAPPIRGEGSANSRRAWRASSAGTSLAARSESISSRLHPSRSRACPALPIPSRRTSASSASASSGRSSKPGVRR